MDSEVAWADAFTLKDEARSVNARRVGGSQDADADSEMLVLKVRIF